MDQHYLPCLILERIRAKLEALSAEVTEQGARPGYRYLFARGPDGEYLGFAEFEF